MLRRLLFFSAFCIYYAASMKLASPGPAYPPTKGEVWPKPQQQIKYQYYYKLSPSLFKFTENGESCEILKSAVNRYTTVLKKSHHLAWRHSKKLWKHGDAHNTADDPKYKGTLEELQIRLSSPCETYPYMDMDEKYSLNVSAVSILESGSIWGVLRGMETFSQLFYMPNGYKELLINSTEIIDFPRYVHRGLLIDTGRHYLSVSNILKTLDAMEMNKMNVLHWHIVDDQSFPYQSEKFPQLSGLGAYDSSMIYTKININQIVNYAKDRGIRVIPEFDMPGHTRSWGVAYPGILTKCYESGNVVGLGPMDPSNNITYKLIGDLIHEVQDRFPEEYLHLGGDEVHTNCWASNPELIKFMKQHNMTKCNQLQQYFMTQVLPLLKKNTKAVVWQEVFDQGVKLPYDTIIQTWKTIGADDMIRILSAGYKVIYSAPWYLDHVECGSDWSNFYIPEPRELILEEDLNMDDILGGEACMWGELVDDRNIISRVWPRASAAAEILWTAVESHYRHNQCHEIKCRLEEHVCRMIRRGINAQPPNGPGYCVTGH